MDNIDKSIERIIPAFERLQKALIAFAQNAIARKVTPEQIALFDMNNLIMNDLGGSQLVEAVSELSGAVAVARNPAVNAAIGRLNEQFFISDLGKMGDKVKGIIANAFIAESNETDLLMLLRNELSALSPEKVGALLNTSIRTTERVAYMEGLGDLPDDTVFEYTGEPLIETSRPYCVEHYGTTATYGELKGQTNDQGQPVLAAAGGYNCRHQWEEVSGKSVAQIREELEVRRAGR